MTGERHFDLPENAHDLNTESLHEHSAKGDEFIAVTFLLRTDSRALREEANRLMRQPIGGRTYHSRDSLKAKYPPHPQGVKAIYAFAKRNGLDIRAKEPNDALIRVLIPLSRAQELFGVDLFNDDRNKNGKAYRGRNGRIALSARHFSATGIQYIRSVFGLERRSRGMALGDFANVSVPFCTSTHQTRYDVPTSLKGDNQTIGILEFGGQYTDTTLPSPPGIIAHTVTPISFTARNGAKFQDETALDGQVIATIAPNARQVFYFLPDTEQGWIEGLNYILSDTKYLPTILSISWGYFETQSDPGLSYWSPSGVSALEDLFARAVLLGITVCCASGDMGTGGPPDGSRVYYPASSQYVLSCGGTTFNGTDEAVWCSSLGASGGGISDRICIPKWQDPSIVKVAPTNPYRPLNALNGRRIPDVAAIATGYFVNSHQVSGTSAAAPFWAGLLALANQRIEETPEVKVKRTVGNITALFYSKSIRLKDMCNDVRFGNNAQPPGNNYYYQATPGWNACAGWGTPIATNLIQALVRIATP